MRASACVLEPAGELVGVDGGWCWVLGGLVACKRSRKGIFKGNLGRLQ